MRIVALLLAPGMLLAQLQLAPGSVGMVDAGTVGSSATVSLRAVGSSAQIPAQVLSVDGFTITFVVPSNAPFGAAQLIYKVAGGPTQWAPVSVVPVNFTIGAVQTPYAAGTGHLNDLSKPVQPGDAVAMWGTGLGLTAASNVTVTFGGIAQKVLYAGPAPNLPGVNQINFQVGAGVPDGCYVPVVVSAGASSATTYLAKSSNGGPCPHPFGLSSADLAKLDAGGYLDVGQIQTTSNVVAVTADHASRQENAGVSFSQWGAQAFAGQAEGTSWLAEAGPPDLRVGSQSLSGIDISNGATFSVNGAPLAGLPPPVFSGGSWTWSNSGGASLAASSFTFNLLPPILITGAVPMMWASAHDQTITWNPAGYDSGAILRASLNGATDGTVIGIPGAVLVPSLYSSTPLATVTVPANSGTLTFPAATLAKVGAGAATLVVQVTESFVSSPAMQFKETNGNTLLMLVNASTSETLPVDIQ